MVYTFQVLSRISEPSTVSQLMEEISIGDLVHEQCQPTITSTLVLWVEPGINHQKYETT